MLTQYFRGIRPATTMGLVCLAVAYVRSAPGEPKMSAGEPGSLPALIQESDADLFYIGSDGCFTCHREQGGSWSETKHAKAFENLPEKYRTDSSCLKCHVTAFGENGGYSAGMAAADAQPFLSVGCESCHGPGSRHAAGVQRWMLAEPADEERLMKEMKAAIRKNPEDNVSPLATRAKLTNRILLMKDNRRRWRALYECVQPPWGSALLRRPIVTA